MNKAFSFIRILLIALVSEGVFATTTTLTVDVEENTIDMSGIPAIRETCTLLVTNAPGLTAGNLKFCVIYDDTIYAQTASFTNRGSSYADSLDLNTVALTNFYATFEDQSKRQFTVTLWDQVNYRLVFNDKISIQNNPYVAGMDPATVVSNDYNAYVDSLLGQTQTWNKAAADAIIATNWIGTNVFGDRLTALEDRTGDWNTASTDASSWTNWASTWTVSVEQAVTDATYCTNWIASTGIQAVVDANYSTNWIASTGIQAVADASSWTNASNGVAYLAAKQTFTGATNTFAVISATDGLFSGDVKATGELHASVGAITISSSAILSRSFPGLSICNTNASAASEVAISASGATTYIGTAPDIGVTSTVVEVWDATGLNTTFTNGNVIAEGNVTADGLSIDGTNVTGIITNGTSTAQDQLATASFVAAAVTAGTNGNYIAITNWTLVTFSGSTNIVTLGTIGTGTWQGDVIATNYLNTNGSYLLTLNGTQITVGTVADARIAATIARDSEVASATNGLYIVMTNWVVDQAYLTNEALWIAASNGVAYLAAKQTFTGATNTFAVISATDGLFSGDLLLTTTNAPAAETNTMTNSPDVNNNASPKWFEVKDSTGNIYLMPAWEKND